MDQKTRDLIDRTDSLIDKNVVVEDEKDDLVDEFSPVKILTVDILSYATTLVVIFVVGVTLLPRILPLLGGIPLIFLVMGYVWVISNLFWEGSVSLLKRLFGRIMFGADYEYTTLDDLIDQGKYGRKRIKKSRKRDFDVYY